MEPDATYKYLHSSAVMVEDLMRWLVAERHGMHALVEALDFATLARVHEQSVAGDGEALRRRSNDMVWRVHLREHGAGDAPRPARDRSELPRRPAATVRSPKRPGRGCTWW